MFFSFFLFLQSRFSQKLDLDLNYMLCAYFNMSKFSQNLHKKPNTIYFFLNSFTDTWITTTEHYAHSAIFQLWKFWHWATKLQFPLYAYAFQIAPIRIPERIRPMTHQPGRSLRALISLHHLSCVSSKSKTSRKDQNYQNLTNL